MADVIRKTTNRWTKGLVMDFSPENTRNEVLTNALNATLMTFNGNELSLQNDMGNARVETAVLPDGYIPVGTCEYGGVIYIVSYNPLEDKSQIGCFPSPERNINVDEIGLLKQKISNSDFQDGDKLTYSKKILLKEDKLNPGDKFIVMANQDIYKEAIRDMEVLQDNTWSQVEHPAIKLSVVSIEDTGKIIYLDSELRDYTKTVNDETDKTDKTYKYHILGSLVNGEPVVSDIDQYRNVLTSGYNVFKSKTSGQLSLLAELVMIDEYSVTHEIVPSTYGKFDILIHTEVAPEVNANNYIYIPKLKYYYLDESHCELSYKDDKNNIITENLSNSLTTQDQIYYYPTNKDQVNDQEKQERNTRIAANLCFPKEKTYHCCITETAEINPQVRSSFTKNLYYRVYKSQFFQDNKLQDWVKILLEDGNISFFQYKQNEGTYTPTMFDVSQPNLVYYIEQIDSVYIDAQRKKENQGLPLYKLTNPLEIATDAIKKDASIEKFVYKSVVSYRYATKEDISNGVQLLEKIVNEDGEVSYSTVPQGDVQDGKVYYVANSENSLVSYGKVDASNLTEICYYYPGIAKYVEATEQDKQTYFDIETYPMTPEAPYGHVLTLYLKQDTQSYKVIPKEEAGTYQGQLYKLAKYEQVDITTVSEDYNNPELYLFVRNNLSAPYTAFQPSYEYNRIKNIDDSPKQATTKTLREDEGTITLLNYDKFLPNVENNYTYESIRLGEVTIPEYAYKYGNKDIPCKYTYSLIPCMNYGKLNHLKITNTIDFNKLNDFNESNFNTWKYYVEDDQLRLTFGAEVYDTFEQNKVSGLKLEFYDCWGKVGHLIVNNKKSYSGIFTKYIPLNTANALNTDGQFHNVNIKHDVDKNEYNLLVNEEPKTLTYNNKWEFEQDYVVPEEYNDSGVLHSNMLYGVKAYFIVSDTEIYKDTFFVFTSSIYNQYYYTVQNFNTITKPKLELLLTYRLQDSGSISPYEQLGLNFGYNEDDKKKYDDYILGNTKDENLDLIKYYEYSGTTSLNLEIGLKEEYTQQGFSYDPAINEHFSCNLQIQSDSGEVVDVISDTLGTNDDEILNLNGLKNDKSLKFDDDSISKPIFNLRDYNFINPSNTPKSIPLNYKFVVGYKVSITDLKEVSVPATTVCALCHKDDNGNYNYEDFGIYEKTLPEGGSEYLSSCMFCSRGTLDTEVVGVVVQQQSSGDTKGDALYMKEYTENPTSKTLTPGRLYSGDSLKWFNSKIGKLQFQQPHCHGFDSDDRNTIEEKYNTLWVSYGTRSLREHHYGSSNVPPKYNMCINTLESVKYDTQFISTMPVKESSSLEDLEFIGFTGQEIATFNKNLLEVMKQVYVYNPDYNSIQSRVGTVSIQTEVPRFTSNIISSNAKLDNPDSFNNFIYLHGFKYSEYLANLKTFAGIDTDTENEKISNIVSFIPDLYYCGETALYLISSLTYNVTIPKELSDELEVQNHPGIIIRHENGEKNLIMTGDLNKKALYGWKDNKLIQLDVSNYSITENKEGQYILDVTYTIQGKQDDIINEELTSTYFTYNNLTGAWKNYQQYTIPNTYKPTQLPTSNITLNDLIYEPNIEGHRLFMKSSNYRALSTFDKNTHGLINYNTNGDNADWQSRNTLYLFTGPSYKPIE